MAWFSKPEVKGKDRIQNVVGAFKTQITELDKGIIEVDEEMLANDKTVEDIRAEAIRVEQEMTEQNESLGQEKDLANGLKASIERILDPEQV